MKARIRKIVTVVEETRTEMGRDIDPPHAVRLLLRSSTIHSLENMSMISPS